MYFKYSLFIKGCSILNWICERGSGQIMTIATQSLFPGIVWIFGSKIQDFPQTFSKTIIYFSRLKVIKQVSNRDLKKSRNRALSMMNYKRTGNIEYDFSNRKIISLVKYLLQLSKNVLQFFPDIFSIFRLFPGLENCWANFKTFSRIQRLCMNPFYFKISLKKYIINSYKSRRFEQFHCQRSLHMFAIILVFINLHTDCS